MLYKGQWKEESCYKLMDNDTVKSQNNHRSRDLVRLAELYDGL